jgi:hypothetical protein
VRSKRHLLLLRPRTRMGREQCVSCSLRPPQNPTFHTHPCCDFGISGSVQKSWVFARMSFKHDRLRPPLTQCTLGYYVRARPLSFSGNRIGQ